MPIHTETKVAKTTYVCDFLNKEVTEDQIFYQESDCVVSHEAAKDIPKFILDDDNLLYYLTLKKITSSLKEFFTGIVVIARDKYLSANFSKSKGLVQLIRPEPEEHLIGSLQEAIEELENFPYKNHFVSFYILDNGLFVKHFVVKTVYQLQDMHEIK